MSETKNLAEVAAIHDDWLYSMDVDDAYLCRGCRQVIGRSRGPRSPGIASHALAAHQAAVVLEALAEQAEADTVRLFVNEREKCSDWLRAKAAELRY